MSAAEVCGFYPLFIFWEQDKLPPRDRAELKTLFDAWGYTDYAFYHLGFKGRPQDMYALLHPSSSRYWDLCGHIEDRAGIYLYTNSMSRKNGLPIEREEFINS